ncbi:MAG: FmdB family zinc ribbon protein [Roseiflexaceae bacterium]
MPIYEYECSACGRRSSILFRSYAGVEEAPHCRHCDSATLTRVPSCPGLIHSAPGASGAGELRAVEPRRAVENMSRQYDQAGIDPGRGFEEVARRAAAGDRPEALKEIVAEARKSEGSLGTGGSEQL